MENDVVARNTTTGVHTNLGTEKTEVRIEFSILTSVFSKVGTVFPNAWRGGGPGRSPDFPGSSVS